MLQEPEVYELPVPEFHKESLDLAAEIRPEDVPMGDSVPDRRARQEIIKQFYFYWKKRNPLIIHLWLRRLVEHL